MNRRSARDGRNLGNIYDDRRTCGATLILSSIVESMNMAGGLF
jgi:hypothetical protein